VTTSLDHGYPTANLILTPCHTRNIIVLLTDVHGLLDYLFRAGVATPETTAAAQTYLHETLSDHTLDTLIDAIDSLATHLTWAMRHAIIHPDLPGPASHRTDDF
jgi:hypothetical protein